jgi:hypothetical protein
VAAELRSIIDVKPADRGSEEAGTGGEISAAHDQFGRANVMPFLINFGVWYTVHVYELTKKK